MLNTASIELKGNVVINGGSLVLPSEVSATTPITLTFNGTTAQRIGGTAAGTFTLPTNTTLALDNPAGLTLERPVLTSGAVTLTQGLLTTSNTNRLTLSTTASITSSATSFVQGPLVRQSSAAGALFFPIGKGSVYRPLTLTVATAPAGTTSYMAEQREGRHTDRTFLGNLKQVCPVRSYSVIPSPVPASGAFAGTITLSFGADDGVTDPSAPSLVVAKTDGSGWTNTGRTDYTTNSLTSDTFIDFSDFALGSTSTISSPLPVSLISFSGNYQPEGVQLRWATASEKQNAYFEVERRSENQLFSTLTRVAGRGNSASATNYSFLDTTPQAGKMYYRLHQVDTDGTATYSSVLAVTVQSQSNAISLYPNPTAHQLRITGASAGGQYRVLNAQGSVKLSGQITPGLCLNVKDLPAGFYRLELLQGQRRTLYSFVRSHE